MISQRGRHLTLLDALGILAVIGATCGLAAAGPKDKEPPGGIGAVRGRAPVNGSKPTRSWERYREIAARNIFSRSGRPPLGSSTGSGSFGEPGEGPDGRRTNEGRGPGRGADDPDRQFVLVGVSKVGERQFAFFENTREGGIRHATLGDTVGKRKLTALTLDHVEYEDGGKAVRVSIGMTLAGEEPLELKTSAPASAAKQPAPGPAGATAPGPEGDANRAGSQAGTGERPAADNGDNTSVLERLLRRRQEGR